LIQGGETEWDFLGCAVILARLSHFGKLYAIRKKIYITKIGDRQFLLYLFQAGFFDEDVFDFKNAFAGNFHFDIFLCFAFFRFCFFSFHD
jgi:hypothetical protein